MTADTALRRPVLRAYIPPHDREAHLRKTTRICEAVGVGEVMLFTSPAYAPDSGFIGPDALARRVEHLHWCKRALEGAGFGFSLNVFTHLGHVYVPEREVASFGFERQLDAEGAPAQHPVLDPYCEPLHAYLCACDAAYAALRPRMFFLDDDFGVPLSGCYHPQRVRRFAAQLGCQTNRAAVRALLHSEDEGVRARARAVMFELITADLQALARDINAAVHGVDPCIRLGLMHPGQVFFDVACVAQTLAAPHAPLVRPQIALYRESLPLADYPAALWSLGYWKAKLPADTDLLPEVESYPYEEAIKSSAAVIAHMAACFSMGEPALALSLHLHSPCAPAPSPGPCVRRLAMRRPQTEAIVRLIQGATRPVGLPVWEPGAALMTGEARSGGFAALRCLGLPAFSARSAQDAVAHFGQGLAELSDEAALGVLARGALLDLDACDVLAARGLLARLGVSMGAPCVPGQALNLLWKPPEGTAQEWPIYYFVRAMGAVGMPCPLCAPGAQALGRYLDDHGEPAAPFILLFTGIGGARCAVVNARMGRWPRAALANSWIPGLIGRAAEWVAGAPLPVYIARGDNVAPAALALHSDAFLLSATSFHSASQAGVVLSLGGVLAAGCYAQVDAAGGERPLAAQLQDGRALLRLPGEMACLEVRYLLARIH